VPNIFGAPVSAAYHLVFMLAVFLGPLSSGLATAAAIVLFTMAVRLLLVPLSYYAFRGQSRMSAIAPKVAELRSRYARQPDRLETELATLYRNEAGGMLSGCLPLLLQIPFFTVMYRLFLSKTVAGKPNALLSRDLLTTPLGSHWLTGAGPLSGQGLLFLCLFALLACVAFVSVRMMRSTTQAAGTASAGTAPANGTQAGGNQAGGPSAGLVGTLGRFLPYTTVVVAAFVPLAAGLYLLTTTSWTAAERTILRRRLKPDS
jgi:YidC/Oxa1 family membrane protein insertase